ncbi:hypothetical protein D3C71_78100 [compost metagenome]
MANLNLIPAISTRGLYTLAAPFDQQVLAAVPYTCVAVRKLEDIVASGADPKAVYYDANDIDDARYQQDLDAGVCIVSLQAAEGSWIYVPSSFITVMPDQGGIPYRSLVLAVPLGAVPDALDLSYIKTQLAALVLDNLGVTVEVKEVAVSPPGNLSQSEHDTLEAARQANITNRTTLRAQLIAVTAQRDAANAKIAELEEYIIGQAVTP